MSEPILQLTQIQPDESPVLLWLPCKYVKRLLPVNSSRTFIYLTDGNRLLVEASAREIESQYEYRIREQA